MMSFIGFVILVIACIMFPPLFFVGLALLGLALVAADVNR